MRNFIFYLFITAIFSLSLFAQPPGKKPGWNVTLPTNKTARSNITVQNRCQNSHNFKIQPQNVSFLEISQSQVSVGGGGNKNVPVRFNTADLEPKVYRGNVLVICETCSSEPTCSQDRENLPVILTVSALPKSSKEKNPCTDLKIRCDELLVVFNQKLSVATNLQNGANTERGKAETAQSEARQAEQEARMAEEAAKDDRSDYRARVNDKEYSSADTAYLETLRAQNLAAYQAGTISANEYQARAKALTPSKAREERLKNKERLKKEAKEARKKADEKRKTADKAKKAADDAQKKADDAKAEADAAGKAYEECLRKAKVECDKIKAQKAAEEAERKKRAAAEKKAADEAERLRVAEEKRKEAEEARAAATKEYNKYLVDNIKKLGLIDSRAMARVPGIWDWLPDIIETPIGVLLEQQTAVPIPTDTLKALGGLYGIVGKMLDPCTKAGKDKTIARLQEMTNPNTNKKYTFGEALKKTDDMCKLLGDLRGKLKQLEDAQKRRK